MMRVAIAGGAGYTGGELIRLLLGHSKIELVQVLSQSQAGKKLYEVHPDLVGSTELAFSKSLDQEFDAIFLCMGHGRTESFLAENPIGEEKIIIDLSNEYRDQSQPHGYIYGLPEWQREKIKNSRRIANPGCFSTNIHLALLPLAAAGLLTEDITATAITGSTGAGLSPSPTTHFSWRNNNISIYKLGKHQHVPEIYQSIRDLQSGFDRDILMVPIRGDFPRGIFASVVTGSDLDQDALVNLYKEYYQSHPFTFVTERELNLKQVVNTNRAYLRIDKISKKVHITSILDNLLKGASGQALQNLNLIAGWDENLGLELKPVVY